MHDKYEKHVSNPEEGYKIIKDHFNSIELLSQFTGQKKILNKPITTEKVRQATLKLNSNKDPGTDRTLTELVKYSPVEVHYFYSKIIKSVLKNHQMVDIGRGSLCPLYKPGKPTGPMKNLRPVILLAILRKKISSEKKKLYHPTETCEAKVKYYLSQSQSSYRLNRNTSDVLWTYR